MFSFFKRKPDPQVPEWAPFENYKEFQAFEEAIGAYFRAKKVEFTLEDGYVNVGPNTIGFGKMGLGNLAQVCAREPMSRYKALVADHFDTLERASSFNKKFDEMVDDFDSVRKYLGVRLYPKSYVDHLPAENLIIQEFAGDVFAMLVFDLPESVTNVQPKQIGKWGRGKDELFSIGIQNIAENNEFKSNKVSAGGFEVLFFEGVHFFVPNIVFQIPKQPELRGPFGCLVAIPNRHAAIIYPIRDMEVVQAVNGLIPAANGMCEKGPGSLSNHIFWFTGEKFVDLPYQIEGENLRFFPPAEFVQMLNQLAGSDN